MVSIVPASNARAAGLVQSPTPVATNSNGTNSVSISFNAANSGNLLVVVCSAGRANTLSVAGYTQAVNNSGAVSQGIFYTMAAGGETTASCTRSNKKGTFSIQMYEYSGVQPSSPLAATGTNLGTTAAVSSGSATPTSSGSLVFTAITTLTGTSFTAPTPGYTSRLDTFNLLHMGQADMFTPNTGAQSYGATNSTAVAWRGSIAIFNLVPGTMATDMVDGSGIPISNPAVAFSDAEFALTCQTAAATFGSTSQRLKIDNGTFGPSWDVSIAPTLGAGALWSDGGTNRYDFNDSSSGGCADGGDTDTYGGQLSINPSAGSIVASPGCSTSGLALGSARSFAEGAVDSVVLASASSSAPVNCVWYVTGVSFTQKVPPEQANGTYTLSLTVTMVAR